MNTEQVTEVVGKLSGLLPTPSDVDEVKMTSDQRIRGHLLVTTGCGRHLALSLPRGQELEDGDVLAVDGSVAVVVRAAEEDVLEARPGDRHDWARTAYNLGNLHRPARVDGEVIVTPYEGAAERALIAIGVPCRRIERSFVGDRLGPTASHAHAETAAGGDHHG